MNSLETSHPKIEVQYLNHLSTDKPNNFFCSQDREFTGKVVEIVNGDAIVVKVGKEFKKIHLASIK